MSIFNGRSICLAIFVGTAFLAAQGCSSAAGPGWRLTSGASVATLAGPKGSALILVLDPQQCFTCTSDVAEWMDVRYRNPEHVHLVLSRSPDRPEWIRLKEARIPFEGILRNAPTIAPPLGLVFRNGSLEGIVAERDLRRLLSEATADSTAVTRPHALTGISVRAVQPGLQRSSQ